MLLINSCSNGQQPRDIQLAASVDEQLPTNQLRWFSHTGQRSIWDTARNMFFLAAFVQLAKQYLC